VRVSCTGERQAGRRESPARAGDQWFRRGLRDPLEPEESQKNGRRARFTWGYRGGPWAATPSSAADRPPRRSPATIRATPATATTAANPARSTSGRAAINGVSCISRSMHSCHSGELARSGGGARFAQRSSAADSGSNDWRPMMWIPRTRATLMMTTPATQKAVPSATAHVLILGAINT